MYVRKQLQDWRLGINPTDQWIRSSPKQSTNGSKAALTIPAPENVLHSVFERQLAGLYLKEEEAG
jgi:hypothetical protein